MKLDVFNQNNEKVGEVDVPEEIFNEKWRPDIVHQAIVAHMANRRRPVAHAKGRGEVRGGGKKPWRQKGTGRARHGSIRSPIWVGGGVTFGPSKEKDYTKKMNDKMKKKAFFSLLSKKLNDSEIKVVDNLKLEDQKTKLAAQVIKNIIPGIGSSLVIISQDNPKFHISARNIPKVKVSRSNSLNIYECAAKKYLIFEKNAVEEISNIYKK